MTYDEFCKKNPELDIKRTTNKEFGKYGKIWTDMVMDDVSEWYAQNRNRKENSGYVSSNPEVESLPAIQKIRKVVYGEMDIQAGECYGDNNCLNGIEYHIGSETIISLEPCILFLGHIWDFHDEKYNGEMTECFFAESGQVIQIYETSLHYTPCKCGEYFYNICILLKGTGDALEDGRYRILKKKNKWFIAHEANIKKVLEGDKVGLLGKMQKVNIGD